MSDNIMLIALSINLTLYYYWVNTSEKLLLYIYNTSTYNIFRNMNELYIHLQFFVDECGMTNILLLPFHADIVLNRANWINYLINNKYKVKSQ